MSLIDIHDIPSGQIDPEQPGHPRDSFLKGALILTGATLIVRLLGIAQKLPLFWLLREEGVGIYNFPYAFYAILLAISSTGINIAISKLVAERLAAGDRPGAIRVFRVSRLAMTTLGVFTATALALVGRFLANNVHHDPRAALSYWVLAPAVFADTLQAAYRGFFQGLQNMRPNALSQVVEQIIRVIIMLSAAYILLGRTGDLGIAAAGATFGSTAGAIGSFLLLSLIYQTAVPRYFGQALREARLIKEPVWPLVRRIFSYSIPISLAGMGLPMLMLADSALVSARLQAAGMSMGGATSNYGVLAGNAMPLVNLPTMLTGALFVTLVPAITESLFRGRRDEILSRSRTALRVTLLFSIPAAVGMYLLAGGIVHLLRLQSQAPAAPTEVVVRALTLGLIFVTLQQTTSGILQGLGRNIVPVVNMFLGAALKAVLTYVLVFRIGVTGAAYATAIGFALTTSLNLYRVYESVGPVIQVRDMIMKPALAAAVMGAAVVPSYLAFTQLLHSAGLATLAAIAVGGVVYGLVMLVVGGLRESDLALIPRFGRPLARTLSRLHLLRA